MISFNQLFIVISIFFRRLGWLFGLLGAVVGAGLGARVGAAEYRLWNFFKMSAKYIFKLIYVKSQMRWRLLETILHGQKKCPSAINYEVIRGN